MIDVMKSMSYLAARATTLRLSGTQLRIKATLRRVFFKRVLGSLSAVRDSDIDDIRLIINDDLTTVRVVILRDFVFPPARLNYRIKPRIPFIYAEIFMLRIPDVIIFREW
jgi:hypothetical protein